MTASYYNEWDASAAAWLRELINNKLIPYGYVEMLDSQGGRCAICGDEPGERYSHQLHVDHCHASGKVRGLLCRGCNHMLGVIKDDEVLLFKAVEYLRKSQRNSLKHS
jgi:hypothetical protein